ncbi:hypothetical protein A4X13_0g2083 [Tilletia indica]|uniref:Uncharacterized protein n=1 Tax=Tilletia indica TaxID=43049 RepID=A0A177TM33_9BASI|nr:hypothetical protein A4X13_0g2083 [Tilletia indica]
MSEPEKSAAEATSSSGVEQDLAPAATQSDVPQAHAVTESTQATISSSSELVSTLGANDDEPKSLGEAASTEATAAPSAEEQDIAPATTTSEPETPAEPTSSTSSAEQAAAPDSAALDSEKEAATNDQPEKETAVEATPAEGVVTSSSAAQDTTPGTVDLGQAKEPATFDKPDPLPKAPDSPAPSVPSKTSTPLKGSRFSSLPTRQGSLPPPPPPEKPPVDEVAKIAQAFGRELSPATTPSPRRSMDKALPPTMNMPSSSSTPATLSTASASAEPARPSGSASPRLSSPSNAGIRGANASPPVGQPPPADEPVFDFNRFLEQMRHRSALPVGEYVRSFIRGFSKKPYRPADQIRLIFDFLAFITDKMKEAEVWATSTPAEFDNATEAMEKLIMNRLYNLTFTPAVAREGKWPVQTDDLERDRIIKDRILLFSWVRPEHLDIPVGEHTAGFVEFAAQELLKMNNYKAPRDKLICILNCCKVIFGMIRHMSTSESADSFVPALIYVVLKANPDNLVSNVEYISRFRSPERLSSESGYYLSSLAGAISFLESMDHTSLTGVTQEDMERNVDAAVTALTLASPPSPPEHGRSTISISGSNSPFGEEGARTLQSLGPIAASLADDTRMFLQRTGEAARAGFAGGLGKPMGALGKLFNEGLDGIRSPSPSGGNSSSNQLGGPSGSSGR